MDMTTSVFLVVDDIETMRKVISNQLRMLGASQILTANNGVEALKILKRQHVSVVLSDWNMPLMTGLELLKAMRADPALYRLPLVMITAEAERARVEEAIANGVSNLLVKPYTVGSLAERIEKAVQATPRQIAKLSAPSARQAQGSTPVPAPMPTANRAAVSAPKEPAPPPTILIVDDTPDNLQLLSELFMDDYRVRVADNGQKALDICFSDKPPDLVLLDVMMPGMDGFEVARRMREHPNAESTPVIFVTALTTLDAQTKGLELGAVDFVSKPIDPDLLKPRVRNFMRYVALHKQLQAEYDAMLMLAQLREDVEMITRHDIKSPLAGIMTLVQPLIEEQGLSADHTERLRLIEEMALQALDVVNLTTELYKIETGIFVLVAQPVLLGDILRRVVDIAKSTFAVKQLQLSLELGGATPETLQALGDPLFCYSILQNLIKNACEASPDGGTISVSLTNEDPLKIIISNTGAVVADIRERFFEKFVTAGKAGGTGIGTYSAKLLIEAQGGHIRMKADDDDNRTEVIVTLPKLVK
ncbi:MAG: hybrid sensor histidine kinase/response regulator [Rhodocyclaceae bacterium]|nr:hybrid sensor histidine kinase/response regulator [Rhodocyclaceae bacterium]